MVHAILAAQTGALPLSRFTPVQMWQEGMTDSHGRLMFDTAQVVTAAQHALIQTLMPHSLHKTLAALVRCGKQRSSQPSQV